jgi:hypothetical protein
MIQKCVYFFLLTLVGCGGGSNGPPLPGGPPPIVGGFTVLVTGHGEIEPNNSLASADAITLPTHGANADYVGFGVIGGVNDTADLADYFVFTASRTHVFTVQMCPSVVGGFSSCNPFNADHIDTSVAYFEVLDQNGILLLSSQGDIAAGNFQDINIDAGVAYYLAVFAEDTVGATQSYYIEMVEKAPLP